MTERRWGDIAYHYLIGPSGNVYVGRSITYKSDTATNYNPDGHVTVCLLGNFEEQQETSAAEEALVKLVVRLLIENDLPPERVTTHRRLASTLCPGGHLQKWLDTIGLQKIREHWEAKPRLSPAPP